MADVVANTESRNARRQASSVQYDRLVDAAERIQLAVATTKAKVMEAEKAVADAKTHFRKVLTDAGSPQATPVQEKLRFRHQNPPTS